MKIPNGDEDNDDDQGKFKEILHILLIGNFQSEIFEITF